MREPVLTFVIKNLRLEEIKDKDVLEVGSNNVNGTVKDDVMKLYPKSYLGIDIRGGRNVDKICNAEDIVEIFGEESFDAIISTETLEHIKDWKKTISGMKKVVKKDGIIILTTVPKGFPYHGEPYDYWRFELEDLKEIFNDCELMALDIHETSKSHLDNDNGVFIKVKKGQQFIEKDLSKYNVYEMEQPK